MAPEDKFNHDVGGTVDRLQEQLDAAVERTVDLHRTGAHEEAVLAETAVAVGAAKALEILTGETVEAQLERREEAALAAEEPSPEPRRWLRRAKPDLP